MHEVASLFVSDCLRCLGKSDPISVVSALPFLTFVHHPFFTWKFPVSNQTKTVSERSLFFNSTTSAMPQQPIPGAEYAALSDVELSKLLKARGYKSSGTNEEKVERLRSADARAAMAVIEPSGSTVG